MTKLNNSSLKNDIKERHQNCQITSAFFKKKLFYRFINGTANHEIFFIFVEQFVTKNSLHKELLYYER